MPINPNNLAATARITFDNEFATMPLSLWNGTSGTWSTTYIFADPNGNGSTLASNGEQEWYINNLDPQTASVVPWYVQNGVLNIVAQPASTAIQPLINNYKYTSGLLETSHSFNQTYGYFEISAKLPAGQGLWPAFWLLPQNGAWPPELDAMEVLGSNPSALFTTVHSAATGTNTQQGFDTAVPNTSSGFHTYGVDWEPDYITWYFDGEAVFRAATPADMNQPMYMLMNLAVGGSWPGDANASTPFPADMQVQWVRAFQSTANAPVETSPTTAVAATGSGAMIAAAGASVPLAVNGAATSAAMLSNGEIAIVSSESSGSSAGALFTAAGAATGVSLTLQGWESGGPDPQVAALGGGMWQVTYAGAGAPDITQEVYDSAGNMVFLKDAFVTGSPVFAALTTGGYVVTRTTTAPNFLLVDAGGKINWVPLPTSAGGTALQPTAIQSLADGGFVFSYAGSAELDRYSFNGGVHTTIQLASAPAGGLAVAGFTDLVTEAAWVGGSGALSLQGFGPTGTALGSAVTVAASVDAGVQPQLLATGVVDDSVALWSSGGTTWAASFNGVAASGAVALAPAALSGVKDAVLTSGEIALSWVETDNGVQQVWAEVLNPATMQVSAKQDLGAGTGQIHLLALKGGGFVESWHAASGIEAAAWDGLGHYGPDVAVSGDFLGLNGAGQAVAVGMNASGQASLQTYSLSTPPPPAVTEALVSDTGVSASDRITSDPAVTGSGDPNAVVHFQIDGAAVSATATANAGGVWTFTPTGLADGSHTITASETNAFGETGSASLTFALDTHPAVAAITHFTETALRGGYSLALSGTATDLTAVEQVTIYEDGTRVGAVTPGAGGAWSFTDPKVTSAVHAFTLQTEDAAGNVGPGVGELLLGTQNVTALTGTSGDDLIYAGPGVHAVTGDGGHDTFVYRETSDAPTPFLWFFGMGSYDTITDFNPAADRIDLSALGHLTYGGETMSISANHVDWYVSGGNTYVIANVGGGMLANMTIKLDGVHTLTSSDFVLS